jgi:hypothetical protein
VANRESWLPNSDRIRGRREERKGAKLNDRLGYASEVGQFTCPAGLESPLPFKNSQVTVNLFVRSTVEGQWAWGGTSGLRHQEFAQLSRMATRFRSLERPPRPANLDQRRDRKRTCLQLTL